MKKKAHYMPFDCGTREMFEESKQSTKSVKESTNNSKRSENAKKEKEKMK